MKDHVYEPPFWRGDTPVRPTACVRCGDGPEDHLPPPRREIRVTTDMGGGDRDTPEYAAAQEARRIFKEQWLAGMRPNEAVEAVVERRRSNKERAQSKRTWRRGDEDDR